MIIKRIKAKNFKTYLNLDLDISVEPLAITSLL